jgi:hypothetical protein
MTDTDDARLMGELRARVTAIEEQQKTMGLRQQDILTALQQIQSKMDQALGGTIVVRWILAFFGLGTIAGLMAIAREIYIVFNRGG